jgi:hypothetical protein
MLSTTWSDCSSNAVPRPRLCDEGTVAITPRYHSRASEWWASVAVSSASRRSSRRSCRPRSARWRSVRFARLARVGDRGVSRPRSCPEEDRWRPGAPGPPGPRSRRSRRAWPLGRARGRPRSAPDRRRSPRRGYGRPPRRSAAFARRATVTTAVFRAASQLPGRSGVRGSTFTGGASRSATCHVRYPSSLVRP